MASPVAMRGGRSRILGAGLVVYGGIGLALLAVAAIGLGPALERVDDLAGSLDDTVARARSTLETTAEAFDGFDASIVRARAATANAAQLVRDTSVTMADLARAMSVQILGTQPLLPLAAGFQLGSEQLVALGGDLDAMGDALGANRADVRSVARELAATERELGDVESALVPEERPGDGPGTLRLLVVALIGWLAVPAAGSVVVGLLLLTRR